MLVLCNIPVSQTAIKTLFLQFFSISRVLYLLVIQKHVMKWKPTGE
jgi:hypothetical protein